MDATKQEEPVKDAPVQIDKRLEKFYGKVLFPEKLAEANKTLERVGVPKIPKK